MTINRLGNWVLPGVVVLSVGLGGAVAQVGGYPVGRSVASFILIGLGIYFMVTGSRRQFPWPLFMILPGVFSLAHLFGWSQRVPAGAYGYGTLIIIGVWLLLRLQKKQDEEDE